MFTPGRARAVNTMFPMLAGALAGLMIGASAHAGPVLFVDDDAPPGGNGSTWSTAFNFLQDALAAAAKPAGGVTEIHVAQGAYLPDRDQANPKGSGDRAATFRLVNGVAIMGGYLGLAAGPGQDPDARDIDQYLTILTGDLASDDPTPPPATVDSPVDPASFINTAENAYQVVTALNVDQTAVLDGVEITAGHADGPGFGAVPESKDQGSGLNVYFATPTLVRCTFRRNWSHNHGAVNDHGSTTLLGCTFRDNYSEHFGAGLYSHHTSATTAVACVFIGNNAAGEGGGGYSRSMNGAAYLFCEFHDNLAVKGGGFYNAPDSQTTFMASSFCDNAASFGGGMYCESSMPMLDGCEFCDNFASAEGGALYIQLGAPSLDDCHFTGNIANGGGGGLWSDHGDVAVSLCTFTANVSHGGGAGMYLIGGLPSVTGCDFNANISDGAGGGLWTGVNTPPVSACTFTNNTAVSGGGMYSADHAAPIVTDCTFTGNHSTEGGGLYNFTSDTVVSNCAFTGNDAIGGGFPAGGGMINYFSSPVVTDCSFTSNFAELGGGGMYNEGEAPTITNCTFIRNFTTGLNEGWGGGVLNSYFCAARITNCLLLGNTARRGGAVFNLTFSTPVIACCTIVANRASEPLAGGAMDNFLGSEAHAEGCIMWNNAPEQIGGVPADVAYCCVQGGYSGTGGGPNNSADPQFVHNPDPGPDQIWGTDDDDYGDLRLTSVSPCIDAGDNTAVAANITIDLANNPRFVDDPAAPNTGNPDGTRPPIDIGAYEFQAKACTGDIANANGAGSDGTVDINDLLFVLAHWGASPIGGPGDIAPPGGDGMVNINDLLVIISAWGPCG